MQGKHAVMITLKDIFIAMESHGRLLLLSPADHVLYMISIIDQPDRTLGSFDDDKITGCV